MRVQIHRSWEKVISSIINQPEFKNLTDFVHNEYLQNTCYPPDNLIFEAFNSCPFDELKVIIIGQDPYHGINQAHGLSFSVPEGVDFPPSLTNIFKELKSDLNLTYPKSGNLIRWAKQGVFLLNATLSVRANQPGSHQKKGWEKFTDQVIEQISLNKKGIVFMLWGGYAKKKEKLVDNEKHLILKSGHPSPLSANRGYWFGNKHFSKCNDYLSKNHQRIIYW